MHIKRCRASIYQARLSIYKELQIIKPDKKFLLNDYFHEVVSSVSRLQDKLSEVVGSNIYRNSRGVYLSNIISASDTSSFSTRCSTSSDNNQIRNQKDSIFLMGDYNKYKMMTSNYTRLTVVISDIIISEGLSFNIHQKPMFKKVLYLEKMCQRLSTSKQNYYIQGYHGCNSLSEHGKEIEFDKKTSDVFELLFLDDGANISRIALLKIFVSGDNLPVGVLELVDNKVHLSYGGGKDGTFICTRFLDNISFLIRQLQMLSCLMELQMYSFVVNF